MVELHVANVPTRVRFPFFAPIVRLANLVIAPARRAEKVGSNPTPDTNTGTAPGADDPCKIVGLSSTLSVSTNYSRRAISVRAAGC